MKVMMAYTYTLLKGKTFLQICAVNLTRMKNTPQHVDNTTDELYVNIFKTSTEKS